MKRELLLIVIGIAGTGLSARSGAQDLPDIASGLQPYVAYHGGELDQVNTENGGLTIRIPLVSYPQKGSLSLSYSVVFNSFGFQDVANCIAAPDPSGPIDVIPLRNGCTNTMQLLPTGIPSDFEPGPRFIADQILWAGGSREPLPLQTQNPPTEGRFYIITSDLAEHPLALSGYTYRSVDGSGYAFAPTTAPASSNGNLGVLENAYSGDPAIKMTRAPGVITDSRGNQYSATYITDVNQNQIAISSSAGSSGVPATDSVGRSIPGFASASISDCPPISAPNQTLVSASSWTPPGTGAGYLFCYASVNIYTNFFIGPTSSGHQFVRTITMLQSIKLPNRTFWGFVYDSNTPNTVPTVSATPVSTGNLLTLIYPTGGSVHYTYSAPQGFCDSVRESGTTVGAVLHYPLAVVTRTEEDAHGNVLGTWHYQTAAVDSNNNVTGSILSPMNELTVTKFTASGVGCGYLDAGQDVYAGSAASGTPLRSTSISYTSPSLGSGGLPLADDERAHVITTTLNGTAASTATKSYANLTFSVLDCDSYGNNCSGTSTFSDPIGSETGTTYTDYGGGTLKTDQVTYEWQSNSSFLLENLLDSPATESTVGSANTSSTTFTYDETNCSGAPGGARGLLTTVSRTNNAGAGPVTHFCWNSNGEKTAATDAKGYVKTFAYSSSPITTTAGQSTTVSCNGSMVTSTTNPLGQTVSGTYDCDGGLLASFTDANNQTTSVQYDDGMHRIQSITYPSITAWNGQQGNPQTSFSYNDSTNTVVESISAAPDPTRTTTVVFDGFGSETQRSTSSITGAINVDTTYDADHRVHTVSNPYVSTSDDSYGLTTFTYDALNRKTSQTHPDGTAFTWTYSGNLVDIFDELQRHTQQTTDALGRLVKVMEPDPYSKSPALETDYAYDALGNLWNVTQWGGANGSSGARVRTFTYNSLSQLLCTSNPENATASCSTTPSGSYVAGTVGYTYDLDGNVSSKTDARGVTTNYGYDAGNRLLSRGYSGDSTGTPWTCFQYDALGASNNGIGRLAKEWTQNASLGSCPATMPSTGLQFVRSIQGYDPMGHVMSEQKCTPGSCTVQSGPTLSYGYDLAGNIGQLTNSIGFPGNNTLNFNYDAGAHLSSVVNQNTSYPSNIFTLQGYGGAGPLTWLLGSNLSFTQDFNIRLWTKSITVQGQKP